MKDVAAATAAHVGAVDHWLAHADAGRDDHHLPAREELEVSEGRRLVLAAARSGGAGSRPVLGPATERRDAVRLLAAAAHGGQRENREQGRAHALHYGGCFAF